MLKPPDHQVAGHQAQDGNLGPLIDGSGRFYKPLQSDERGLEEVLFYTSFASNPTVPNHIRRLFFPAFHGTVTLPASDGSGPHPHLVLDDLVHGLSHPSLIDLKIGSRTWYPTSSDKYFQKCFNKDKESSSLTLGFRISGLRVYKGEGFGFWKPEKKAVKGYVTAGDVESVLRRFVSSSADSSTDCALASVVYGGADGILARLLELKAWFEEQTEYHFYSCSVLMGFEREAAEKGREGRVMVRLVDFAHVLDGGGLIDHNFLGGLCSLIKFLKRILTDAGAKVGKDPPFMENGCLE
ncbi:Inositol polyphosphate multikinase beta [Acorus gramineus]|uniref:Inositol polyphosphate multikinase n=1 Tax=Acorus gramineus TaxID=55184 RepID=A0AAV9A5C4_ACOGR|nr:Inositol polyphosphate multikinase beta [Acorus gramineus]